MEEEKQGEQLFNQLT